MIDTYSAEDLEAIGTPFHLLRRFGIELLGADRGQATTTMAMPLSGLSNPFTGLPTIAPLAILVDAVGGVVNHLRRADGEWTVSTELTVELCPGGPPVDLIEAGVPVIVTGRAVGPRGTSSLAVCTLTCEDSVIGTASVTSFFVNTDAVSLDEPDDPLRPTTEAGITELMAVRPEPLAGARRVLTQQNDPVLINALGIVNGGVAAAGLELVASAAADAGDIPMRTASLRVNFLRPFLAGENSRYEAEPLRVGRGTAVTDAWAIDDDGRVALVARLTAYR
jgi:uncharacterized protein (TIGR00369 family)